MAQIIENSSDDQTDNINKNQDEVQEFDKVSSSDSEKEGENYQTPFLRSITEKMKTTFLFLSSFVISTLGFPSEQPVPSLISFDKGGIGVNFLGYHARAGLGGLLTGNAADGGLHAEAGTPHGQYAGAGLGGTVDQGRAAGGLYAGATAGGGISAAAGLDGATGDKGSGGSAYSGYSVGGKSVVSTKYGGGPTSVQKEVEVVQEQVPIISKEKSVETVVAPSYGAHGQSSSSAGFSGGFHISKTINVPQTSQVHIEEKPVQTVVVEEEKPKPQKTYIERTVIPNYVEKTIHVPSYVEKTIRVPTVVEKRVKVEAPPTIIEKEVAAPVISEVSQQPQQVYVQKVKTVHRPIVRKHFRKYGAGSYGVHSGAESTPVVVDQPISGGSSSGFYVEKRFNGGRLFDDIFNIPISTLQAVNRLVSGIGGGVSGSFAATKQIGTY